jgi:GMP synthase (glutamine-hydrolysing)
MARALGARVLRSPQPEVGWHAINLFDTAQTHGWFGDAGSAIVFQWHEEAFELPPGAVGLAGNAACPHQAFAIGPHLAMQFHVEVDEEKLRRWSLLDTEAYQALQQAHATVHSGEAMREAMALQLPLQQALADRVYARWWGTV